ncbi:MAG: DNA/RNA nuclease SfsA [Acetivibrionales bacterium]
MKYENIEQGKFISRPNRFVANIYVDGRYTKAHVKNTGRLKELLVTGAAVYLQKHDDPKRSTNWSLIGVEKGSRVVNIDSQAPNKVMYEWLLDNGSAALELIGNAPAASAMPAGISSDTRVSTGISVDTDPSAGISSDARPSTDISPDTGLSAAISPVTGASATGISPDTGVSTTGVYSDTGASAAGLTACASKNGVHSEKIINIRPEYTYLGSRFDFLIETSKRRILMEIKGVTLEENGTALFPDAPTERGVRHILELCESLKDGYYPVIVFVIQMSGVRHFSPNAKTHKKFADALLSAHRQGVQIIALDCEVTRDSLVIKNQVDVLLEYS